MAGAPAGNCDYYWHFHNRMSGAVTTIGPLAVLDTPTYTRTFETGVYDVTLEARDRTSGNSRSYLVPDLVCARPLVSYVDPASTAPAFPYDTWATAATNIADALDHQIDGLRIVLAQGVHPVLSEMTVSRRVSIEGASPDTTTLQGNNNCRLFRLSDPGASITGVKLTGGRVVIVVPGTFADPGETYAGLQVVGGGGAVWLDGGGMISNCVIEACTVIRGASGIGVFNDSGLMTHCIVRNFSVSGCQNLYGAAVRTRGTGLVTHTVVSNIVATGVGYESPTAAVHIYGGTLRNSELDLGAFAYVPPEFGVGIVFEGELEAFDRVTLSLEALPIGDTTGAQYHWLLDGEPVGTGDTHEIDSTVLGDHVITLAATNAAHIGAIANLGFTVIPRIVYVRKDNPGSQAPYGTWETACSTFDAAVASARSSATVLVADGDYRLSVQCPVSLPITIKSVNGPYRTVISGNRGFQLIRLDHAGAVLDGFLMTNGLRAVYNSGATVRNCRFTGNTIGRNVAALSLYNDNGRVENCEFFEARRGLSYAHQSDITYGSLYQKGADAVTERCTFRDNYFGNVHQTHYHWVGVGMHMVGGTVRTSLFVANGISNGREGAGSANRSAAGLFMTAGTAANCTFVGNYSLIPPESETGVATNTLGVHAVAGLSAKGITTPGAVKNCLFIGNTNDFGAAGAELFAADGVAVNCRVDVLTPALAAQGCINADPLFRDYAARDFRLHAASPCARGGLADEAWMQGALDLGGEPIMYRARMPVGCFAAKSAATMLIVR